MEQVGLWVCVSKTVCGFLECMCIKKKKNIIIKYLFRSKTRHSKSQHKVWTHTVAEGLGQGTVLSPALAPKGLHRRNGLALLQKLFIKSQNSNKRQMTKN
jgi:hypothetical protein